MKKLFLICNAHLDPVWLWQWKEGAAEALSTFRVAADFCDEFDGFVFNHNEAVLYEWVEKYDPKLFERIKRLVCEGKWIIMGGWYLQPDCTMLSGESFLTQIELGRKYFMEKFGKKPKTAINFDPFGHTKGLVQILQKTGFENYVYMRPAQIKGGDFLWKGFNDSTVTAHGLLTGYNSLKGEAEQKIRSFIDEYKDKIEGNTALTWGVGNHGGGPSKKDLEDITKLMTEEKDVQIIHSDFDTYFENVEKDKLETIDRSLEHTMVGCYTSMSRVKAANRRFENMIAVSEKMAVYAYITRGTSYPEKELTEAKKALAFCQFHDILPGSAIKPAEDDSLRLFSSGEEICDNIIATSFFELAKGQKKANDGEIPIMIYNPHPFAIDGDFEVEFMLQNQNWNKGEFTIGKVYDEQGNALPTQNEKPEATFNLDWLKKVSFRGVLAPSSITRFDCRLRVIEEKKNERCADKSDIVIENEKLKFVMSRKNGHILEYTKHGKTLLEDTGIFEIYNDNEDPWGMTVDQFNDKCGEFKLLTDEEAAEFIGYKDEAASNVKIIEDGDVRTKIQAVYGYDKSYIVAEYCVSKVSADIDVNITVYMNNVNKFVKYALKTKVSGGKALGQTAFGTEELLMNKEEVTYQKWCALANKTEGVAVINDSIYGGSFDADTINISLLRTPIYSAHPIGARQIAPHDRYIKHIDMGERIIRLKITDISNIEQKALAYNEKPIVMSYFPSGESGENEPVVTIDNQAVMLSAVRKNAEDFELHLFNTSTHHQAAKIEIPKLNISEKVEFNGFELKFFKIGKNGSIEEQEKLYE